MDSFTLYPSFVWSPGDFFSQGTFNMTGSRGQMLEVITRITDSTIHSLPCLLNASLQMHCDYFMSVPRESFHVSKPIRRWHVVSSQLTRSLFVPPSFKMCLIFLNLATRWSTTLSSDIYRHVSKAGAKDYLNHCVLICSQNMMAGICCTGTIKNVSVKLAGCH